MADQIFPEPTVGALIFNKEGELLLVKSHKWRNSYVIPGGHIELGETMKAALRREVKEETGLDIYDIQFVSLQEFIFDDAFWKKRHFIFLDFACRTHSSAVTLNSEAQEFVWISPEAAFALPIEPYTKRTLERYLKDRSAGRCAREADDRNPQCQTCVSARNGTAGTPEPESKKNS